MASPAGPAGCAIAYPAVMKIQPFRAMLLPKKPFWPASYENPTFQVTCYHCIRNIECFYFRLFKELFCAAPQNNISPKKYFAVVFDKKLYLCGQIMQNMNTITITKDLQPLMH
jgi:hypothetical protein